jgi:hypothetical protein
MYVDDYDGYTHNTPGGGREGDAWVLFLRLGHFSGGPGQMP